MTRPPTWARASTGCGAIARVLERRGGAPDLDDSYVWEAVEDAVLELLRD